LLPDLAPEQQKIEAAVASPLADLLAIIMRLQPYPQRLLLILFEYRWAVPLHGERELLTKAIQAMEGAFEIREHGYSVKDLDALDTIWWLIERDRKRRRSDVVTQRQSEVTKMGVDGSRRKGNRTRSLVIAMAIDLKTKHPKLSKDGAAKRIGEARLAPCKFEQARNILKKPFEGDPWNKIKLGNS
jgi:hypothetical protein